MSIFRITAQRCPACQTEVDFEAVFSVNADRRPDLRAAILDDTFQERPCPNCGVPFRLDPEFNLLDIQRGQWIAAAPLSRLAEWRVVEASARRLFDQAYGPEAAEVAQEIGRQLAPRVTFGWPALREKLVVRDHELDDVTLELCKAYVMRTVDSPIAAESELRLSDVDDAGLHLAWLRSSDGATGPTMTLSREVYDEIAADADDAWGELRDEVSEGCFVDINRMMIESA